MVRAILFDCVGTLFRVEVDHGLQLKILHEKLVEEGFKTGYGEFMEAYRRAYAKYLKVRMEELREVPNMVWVADALRRLGFEAAEEDPALRRAVEAYFEPYLESVRPIECVPSILVELKRDFKLGVVTNFTYAPTMRRILSNLKIVSHLEAVTISHEVGWRKPHPRIFEAALQALQVQPWEAMFVGDDPHDDIAGGKKAGLKTVLVFKPGNADKRVFEGDLPPDFQVESVCKLRDVLGRG